MATIEEIKKDIDSGDMEALKRRAEEMGAPALLALRDGKVSRGVLHMAARANRPEMVRWLVALGADMECVDIDGSRPLHLAAMNGAQEAARELLEAGAAPDPARRDGKTPYIFAKGQSAAGGGFAGCAKLLEQAGANVDAVDASGRSSASYAREAGSAPSVAERLDVSALSGAFGSVDPGYKPALRGAPEPESAPSGAKPTREQALKTLEDLGFEMLGAPKGSQGLSGNESDAKEIASLVGKRKNVMLVGRAGSGKRSLASQVADALAPQGKIVMSVPSSAFRGTKYAGSVHENIQRWLGAALSLGSDLVLFVNDAHQLSTGKTSSDNTDTPLQILREQLDAKKENRLTLLCASSPKEIGSLEEDEPFMSLFARRAMKPLDAAQTLEALKSPGAKEALLKDCPGAGEQAYARMCAQVVDLCGKYLFNQTFPGKAFNAVARMLSQKGPLEWTQQEVSRDFCSACAVPREIVEGRLRADSVYYKLEDRLKEKLLGQEGPVRDIARAVSSQIVLANPQSHKPVTMLLAGPSGVGKTEACETMAKALDMPLLALNMGEFKSPSDVRGLQDKISEFCSKNYAGVMLFDEIEKSHPATRDLLLSLFDKGSIGAGDGQVSCGFMICAATTNVASLEAVEIKREMRRAYGDPKIHESWIREKMIEQGFRPEFINRIGLAVDFNDITKENALAIAKSMIESISKELKATRGIDIHIDDTLANSRAAEVFDPNFGARGIRRCVESILETIVSDPQIALAIEPGSKIQARSQDGAILARVENSSGMDISVSLGGKANENELSLERLQAVLKGFSRSVSASARAAQTPLADPSQAAAAPSAA